MLRRKILSLYIFKEVTQYFIGALFCFTAMLLALNILKFTTLIINKGVAASQIGMVFVSLIPTFLEIALPMSALLGVMLAFARLSGDSEIVVMRASGISLFQLSTPILFFGAIATALSLYISLVARPWGYENLSRTLFTIASSSSLAGLDEGIFSKLGTLTLYAGQVDHNSGAMKKVLLDDRRDKENRKIVFAKSGSLISNPASREIYINLHDGEIHELLEGKYAITRFQTNSSVLESQDLFNDEGQKKGRQFNSLSLNELQSIETAYTDLLPVVASQTGKPAEETQMPFGQRLSPEQFTAREISKRINRIRIEFGRRFSMPYAVFILACIGMTLGVQPPRAQKTWGIGISAVFGIGVFVIYYGFLSIGIALSEGNQIDPRFALWIPNVAITALALWSFWQIGTERWSSMSQLFESLATLPKKVFMR